MILSHKIRLVPNEAQEEYLIRACGVARFVYNWALERWNEEYKAGLKPSSYSLKKTFNSLYGTQYPWIADVCRDCHCQPFANLQDAFNRFFHKKSKYPVFHKKGRHDSFYLANDKFRIGDFFARLPKIGKIKTRESLRFTGKIMSGTVSRVADRWYLSVAVEVGGYKKLRTSSKIVGVDLGLTSFATLSNKEKIEAPRPLRAHGRRLGRACRSLSRKMKGGRNREKQKMHVAKLYMKMADIRKDFLHKLSTRLCRENQVVVVEDLNVAGMVKNRRLAKGISDSSWSEFRRQLEYKSIIYDTKLVIADRFFPSSKLCSICGWKNENLALSERVFRCEWCGAVLDRDFNAARNLSTLSYRESYACGESGARDLSMKQEL